MNNIEKLVQSTDVTFNVYQFVDDAFISLETKEEPIYLEAVQYPVSTLEINDKLLKLAQKKKVRMLIEYPQNIAGIELGKLRKAEHERTVVCSDFFKTEVLSEGTILAQHSCWFRLVTTSVVPHLALAKVAGYRKTVFGMPNDIYPILFQHPEYDNVMISTVCLSKLVSARFAPKEDWIKIMQAIFTWLNNDIHVTCDWDTPVAPSYNEADLLPENIYESAFNRNVSWFTNNIFFRHSGRVGVCEGFASEIEYEGNQSLRPKTRGDCTGESVIPMALDWQINRNPASREISIKIMETLFNGTELPDKDEKSPTYGGVKFYEDNSAFYGDDNSRAAMGAILASELIENTDYIKNIVSLLLFVLNTTGKHGFRHNFLDRTSSFSDGKNIEYYQNEDLISCHPHFQAYMWAAFLQAYVLTGYSRFLEKAKSAINITMNAFPEVKWTNGITQEYARLLLPLAFLVQIEDTEKHREWLRSVTERLLENLMPCGAVREKMGDISSAQYPAPQSNEDYGTTEAPLIQENGDPVCDLLYTMNFAFLGIHEASIATGDSFYIEAENRLADFLCRIQVSSSDYAYLDGCWMRGFDFSLWEFYGSSADNGWGVRCVESGWTNALISGTLGLKKLKRSFLCHDYAEAYRNALECIIKETKFTK